MSFPMMSSLVQLITVKPSEASTCLHKSAIQAWCGLRITVQTTTEPRTHGAKEYTCGGSSGGEAALSQRQCLALGIVMIFNARVELGDHARADGE
ncbi:hypothetical protein EV363DRAFT_1205999, partial [Boletus edulis]